MIVIICGLPGTGKTTICKELECRCGFKYINDWGIFKENGVIFDKFQNKNEISRLYSKYIVDFIKKNKKLNLVIDLEYSISPNDFLKSELQNYCKIIYLGFVKFSVGMLYNLYKDKYKSMNSEELFDMLKFYKKSSIDYQKQCKAYNIGFKDVNIDRNLLVEEVISKMYNTKKQF